MSPEYQRLKNMVEGTNSLAYGIIVGLFLKYTRPKLLFLVEKGILCYNTTNKFIFRFVLGA